MIIAGIEYLAYRNFRYPSPLAHISVRLVTFTNSKQDISISDAVHLHVRLPVPWTFRLGPYTYLSIPGVNSTGFAHCTRFSWHVLTQQQQQQ